jgi:hypothetical protein
MKKAFKMKNKKFLISILSIAMLLCGCSPSEFTGPDITVDPGFPLLKSGFGYDHFLFCYDKNNASYFQTRYLNKALGSEDINSGSYLGSWDRMTGVQVGIRQFIVGHSGLNDYFIRPVQGDGKMGWETEHGSWNNSYATFFGFHVGDRGFVFGQNSYTNYWFIQEVTSQGKWANETDNDKWNNYYNYATPIYINGKTYIFFQTEDSDNYWFIAYISPEGKLSDVCAGYWDDLHYPVMAAVEINGNAYLVYHGINSLSVCEWFIRKINPDGTMGEETDRGKWNSLYNKLIGYESYNHAYILGNDPDCFIREITAGGKMGAETYHGTKTAKNAFLFPFTFYDFGNFRYEIGWDLSKSTGSPARGWSSLFAQPWSVETMWGGGAALADIDRDAGQRYDAVLTGMQWLTGDDRFYYKIAWNLDNTGKAASWSETIYGPNCGESQAGGGADIADIDRNGVPDLLIMSVDDPVESNAFWYYIGWNMGTNGQVSSWSNKIQLDGLGWDNAGGGLALGDLDGNGITEMVLTAIDNPGGANRFWYKVGRNLDQTGIATSWTSMLSTPFYVGDFSGGGGAALADVNGNGKPDLVLMDIDSPQGANPFWCYIGWDIDINGNAAGWSSFTGPSLGNITRGGGAAVGDIDKNGIPDLLLMTIDNPYGND